MRLVTKDGVSHINDDDAQVYLDPYIGHTQELFLLLNPEPLAIPFGVKRYSSHEEMNKDMDEIVARAKVKVRSGGL